LAALLIALLAIFALASSEADEGDVMVASASSAQNSHSATLLSDGRVLVAGGWNGTTAIANADLFDADARTWGATAPLLTPRIFHAATRLSDGRVLVAGGWDNNGDILTSAEIYDPVRTGWLSAAPLRHARAGHAALTLPDGRVLVVGGCVGSQALGAVSTPGQPWDVQRSVEVYDPRAESWQAAGELAEGRCWPTATLLADGRVLVVGGSDRGGRPVAGAELYDPNRNSWSSAGRLRVAREGHTATLLPDGQVLVAGGYNGEALASTELYNPAANAWTSAASTRQARAYHTAALLRDGKVLAIGGATGGLPSQDTEAYDPRSNTWTPAGPLPAPYAMHLTTVLANGRVVVTGRPSNNDPTGNDGYPTPIGGAQTPTPRGTPAVWWDELSIDPPDAGELDGLYRTVLQQGLGGFTGNHVAWFDGANGYNDTSLLNVGANNDIKTLLRFNMASLPTGAVVDEATLELYYTSKNNGNTLTLGAHRVLAEWTDSEVNRVQRKAGSNWTAAGMASGSDYAAAPEATAALASSGNEWVRLNVTAAAQAWVANPASNHGLVLLQEAASGWVTYQFCSELGWTPCTPGQAPRLVIRYHLEDPAPVKAIFQQGTGGYTGANATCLAYSSGNNSCTLFKAGANDGLKSLLRFDLSTIPAGKTVDEATLRLYYKSRSNGNGLTLGAYRLLAPWVDSQATWAQRITGINWDTPGLGSGADYAAAADDANLAPGEGGTWIELDVTDMAQTWVDDPAANYGLILRQAAAVGYVIYDFCSERGVSPCTAAQTPQLTVWYR
jgi:hypothetical protein